MLDFPAAQLRKFPRCLVKRLYGLPRCLGFSNLCARHNVNCALHVYEIRASIILRLVNRVSYLPWEPLHTCLTVAYVPLSIQASVIRASLSTCLSIRDPVYVPLSTFSCARKPVKTLWDL